MFDSSSDDQLLAISTLYANVIPPSDNLSGIHELDRPQFLIVALKRPQGNGIAGTLPRC